MTVLACRVTEDSIELATDSIMVRGWTQNKGQNKYSKMFKENGMVFGCTGKCEESALLQVFCKTHQPATASEGDILEFFSEFAGWAKERTGRYELNNAYIMIYKKKVYQIEQFFVQEITEFSAHGAGMDFALAALHLGHSPEKACEVAIECCVMCEGPVQIHREDK